MFFILILISSVIILPNSSCDPIRAYTFSFDQIFILNNKTYVEGFYNYKELRVKRFNRTTYGLNAEFEIFYDLDDRVTVDYKLDIKRSNAHEYTTLIAPTDPETLPAMMNKYFTTYESLWRKMMKFSNLPEPMQRGGKLVLPQVRI